MLVTHPFDELKNSFVLTVGDRILPGAAGFKMGAVAAVVSTESLARTIIEQQAEDILTLGLGQPGFQPVGDPWEFMRCAAAEGLAGIAPMDSGVSSRFMFMVRVDEAGRTYPTVLTAITEQGIGASLTRHGARAFEHADLVHWKRFDILDQVSGIWGKSCPFRGWTHGDHLFELAAPDRILLLGEVHLFGNWLSPDGAYPFFTSEQGALDFLKNPIGSVRAMTRLPFARGSETTATFQPKRVRDLRTRLVELQEFNPFADWCVNPFDERENSAIGRLTDFEISEVHSKPPCMRAVSGIWHVEPENRFKLAASIHAWSGKDTIRWSGGSSIQLVALDRSFVATCEDTNEMSDSEIEELVETRILSGSSVPLRPESASQASRTDRQSISTFYLVAWDTVTGNGSEDPLSFQDVFGVLRWLSAYERNHDRVFRAKGAENCQSIGFTGSKDQEREDLLSTRFQRGLTQIGIRVLKQGYRPSDADDLVALCNGTLRTLQVEYAGFAADLLWASPEEMPANCMMNSGIDEPLGDEPSDVPEDVQVDDDAWEDRFQSQRDQILETLRISRSEWESWKNQVEVPVDASGQDLALQRLSMRQWESLEAHSKHFLSTGLVHLEQQGHAPMLDYAPIAIEIVKALEVEFGAIFAAFRDAYMKDLNMKLDARASCSLEGFLAGGKAPTLGSVPYLLRQKTGAQSDHKEALIKFVSSLPNGSEMLRSKFLNKGLHRVVHKYRNGGAHDSPILEQVCRECVEVLVGTKDKAGYIPMVASWKSLTA